MSDKISFSTSFNQPKIILNGSRNVTVPVSGLLPDTLFGVSTGATRMPIPPRVFVEYAGALVPAYGSEQATFETLGISVAFYIAFSPTFDLIIKSYSLEAAPVNAIIHYRVYKDAEPA